MVHTSKVVHAYLYDGRNDPRATDSRMWMMMMMMMMTLHGVQLGELGAGGVHRHRPHPGPVLRLPGLRGLSRRHADVGPGRVHIRVGAREGAMGGNSTDACAVLCRALSVYISKLFFKSSFPLVYLGFIGLWLSSDPTARRRWTPRC